MNTNPALPMLVTTIVQITQTLKPRCSGKPKTAGSSMRFSCRRTPRTPDSRAPSDPATAPGADTETSALPLARRRPQLRSSRILPVWRTRATYFVTVSRPPTTGEGSRLRCDRDPNVEERYYRNCFDQFRDKQIGAHNVACGIVSTVAGCNSC